MFDRAMVRGNRPGFLGPVPAAWSVVGSASWDGRETGAASLRLSSVGALSPCTLLAGSNGRGESGCAFAYLASVKGGVAENKPLAGGRAGVEARKGAHLQPDCGSSGSDVQVTS